MYIRGQLHVGVKYGQIACELTQLLHSISFQRRELPLSINFATFDRRNTQKAIGK
jgi:hypothetical protein